MGDRRRERPRSPLSALLALLSGVAGRVAFCLAVRVELDGAERSEEACSEAACSLSAIGTQRTHIAPPVSIKGPSMRSMVHGTHKFLLQSGEERSFSASRGWIGVVGAHIEVSGLVESL